MRFFDLFRRRREAAGAPASESTQVIPRMPRVDAAESGDLDWNWVVVAWSRELARGKVANSDGAELSFDASIADVDDFAIGERVGVVLSAARVAAVRQWVGASNGAHAAVLADDVLQRNVLLASRSLIDVHCGPAGVFRFRERQTRDDLQRLGDALQAAALGGAASLDLYPSFVCISGCNMALSQDDSWRSFEEGVAAALDEFFGHSRSVRSLSQGLLGNFREVEETLRILKKNGAPEKPFERLFAVSAWVPIAWNDVPRTQDAKFQDRLPDLPEWVGWKNGSPHWYVDREAQWPHLSMTRCHDGMQLQGVLDILAWCEWFSCFEPLVAEYLWHQQ